MDCKVVLNTDQSSRWLKVLREKESIPVSLRFDDADKALPAPSKKTDAQLIQDSLFSHISGAVLYTERQESQRNVKEF